MSGDESKRTEFEYWAQEHRHHNWLIHGTWYLDIVFIAGGIQFYISNSGNEFPWMAAVFASAVFLGLGAYTALQIWAREQVRKAKIELASDLEFHHFKELNCWRKLVNWLKAILLLTVFYIVPLLATLCIVI